ncbi:hypothetical protein DH2020_008131 [Rehmannia glutinosa]|uniref:EF-hand domain-containing protein n=1 Tax=Rehmannia glutinosa TaxID=99300 RepID=A0ABR0U0E7_REHGL
MRRRWSQSFRNFKLRLRSNPTTATPPETTTHGRGEIATLKSGSKEDEFRQVFGYLDSNSDGRISADELREYFVSVGDDVSREEAEKIIGELLGGGGGGGEESNLLLGFGEFVRLMEVREGENDDVLRRAFEVYEVEKGSGFITPEGLRRVLGRLGDVKSVQECRAMIRVYDLDGNGVLDFDEFYKMMT